MGALPQKSSIISLLAPFAVVLTACLYEIAVRSGGSLWLGLCLALFMAMGISSAFQIPLLLVKNRAIQTVLMLAPPFIFWGDRLWWATWRICEVHVGIGRILIFLASTTVSGAIALGIYRLLTAGLLRSFETGEKTASNGKAAYKTVGNRVVTNKLITKNTRLFLSLAIFLGALFPLATFLENFPVMSGSVSLFGFGMLALIGLFFNRFRNMVLVVFVLAGAAAVSVLPVFYRELSLAALWFFIGAAGLLFHHPISRRIKKMKVGMLLCVLSVSGFFMANWIITSQTAAWLDATEKGALSVLVHLGHRATDVDNDSYGAIFAQRDCEPFNGDAHPASHEIVNNNLDDNCRRGDVDANIVKWVKRNEKWHRPPPPWRGDMIVVLIDSLRYDTYKSRMPHLFDFAAAGIQYARAYTTAPFTSCAVTSLFTGRLGANVEMKWYGPLNGVPVLPEKSLVPQLADAGYDTAIVGGIPLKESQYFSNNVFGAGFSKKVLLPRNARPEIVSMKAVQTWREMSSVKPRFLYVHLMSLHGTSNDFSEYQKIATELDEAINKMIRTVGLKPMWLILSDHGDEFQEHGNWHHASSFNEEQTRIPIVVRRPDLPAASIDTVSSLRSVYATLAAMLLPETVNPNEKGPYLCVRQGECIDTPALMAMKLQNLHIHGMVHKNHKAIWWLDRNHLEVFDLAEDPKEQNPLQPVPKATRETLQNWEEALMGPRSSAFFWPYR